jgi:antitoxin component of RelBE/YafQ-DinJ toxin-antitoxin module
MAYDDYYRTLTQGSWYGQPGYGGQQSPVSQSLSAYNPQGQGFNPQALGNQGFFIPSGMGTASQQSYPQGSPVSSALQQYFQGQGGGGAGAGQIGQMMGAGAGTQDMATQLALMNAQFGLQQQGSEAKMGRAQGVAKQLGLDPSMASSMAEQMAAVQSLPIQREKDAAMQAIRNREARGGMGISSEGDKLEADVMGASASALRSSRTMAELQMRQWMTQMLAQTLGQGI